MFFFVENGGEFSCSPTQGGRIGRHIHRPVGAWQGLVWDFNLKSVIAGLPLGDSQRAGAASKGLSYYQLRIIACHTLQI